MVRDDAQFHFNSRQLSEFLSSLYLAHNPLGFVLF